ncbi:PREDICTED: serine/threonine-protein phosphatase 6 regulatory subunit 3 isoform X2 [Tarenaya hassleriana]|uniref:serine/threonine-protein phosphatase 6 regulatory subunit 3 isoform X2 n=1 Tax=Tarenaya hassleriana TaxID=28532 RepID=UPI00053C2D2C|nr:PREDICTED: serine/threonine-protein phosphatase 6 regulatory subunit 3 isoform X2 [Tarenaya hassleriana]
MFWRMAGLSTASPVETILDKDGFTLEELLDEDEIIQECKSLNGRLLNFLRERTQVEQLIKYIIEEPPEDAEKNRTFKFPFIACEIFTCEIEMILKQLVEDEELMKLLFSFLEPKQAHNTLLAGYFSKVVICLLVLKTVPFMQFIKEHQEILKQLVDLIGITSIMEVLKRLIGTDEHLYTNYTSAMQWIEDTDVLEMIVDKFSSSDSPEVHANAAEILCTVTRFAPPGLGAKISSPSFIRRLFQHALEVTRPKSVLVNSLSVCISLLDPKRFTLGAYHMYSRQLTHGTVVTNPETVDGMLGSLGELLKLLNVSSDEGVLLTTFGKLQPPLGKHRLKIVEFISVLLTVCSESAEKDVIRLGAVKIILDLFFEYPYNNFLHHHIENVIVSCLESKNTELRDHLLRECDLVGKILEAEKVPTLAADLDKENSDWTNWQTDVLSKRNSLENVCSWACGRPTSLHDRTRDSDDDDYQDRDYDVAALANNLSQAFRYGIYSNDDIDEAQGSMECDDEDVYFDDESAEVVISSLRLGDDQESGSLFTNSNWFAFEDEREANERSMSSPASTPSPNAEWVTDGDGDGDGDGDVVIGEADDDMEDTAISSNRSVETKAGDVGAADDASENSGEPSESEKSPAWVEWRETSGSAGPSKPNGEVQMDIEEEHDHDDACKNEDNNSPEASGRDSASNTSKPAESHEKAENEQARKVAEKSPATETEQAVE